MKKSTALLALVAVLFIGLVLQGCSDDPDNGETTTEYKDYMKAFVQGISGYAKNVDASFVIIPQNGHELITLEGKLQDDPDLSYLQAIDGVGREDLFYGYNDDNEKSPFTFTSETCFYLEKALLNGVKILVTDYCSTPSKMDDSYATCADSGYISFAADHRDLDNIPSWPANPYNVNADVVTLLDNAKNFLYILDPEGFGTKENFICLLYTSPSPRDRTRSRMPSSA